MNITLIFLLVLSVAGVLARDPRCPINVKKDLYYANTDDCSSFYKCNEDGDLVEMKCEEGLEFDHKRAV